MGSQTRLSIGNTYNGGTDEGHRVWAVGQGNTYNEGTDETAHTCRY